MIMDPILEIFQFDDKSIKALVEESEEPSVLEFILEGILTHSLDEE